MTRKIYLRTNDEILNSRGTTQRFSSYPQLKPRLVFDSEDAMKEYIKNREVIDPTAKAGGLSQHTSS